MSKTFDKIYGTLLYVCVHEPVKAYAKPGTPTRPSEWKASIAIVDEDFVDELEDYAKSLDTMLSVKKVKTVDFEEIYKTAPPEGAGKNVWVLTFRKSTQLGKTGKEVPELYRPKVFEKQGNRIVDITHTKLVGNGSLGAISLDRFDRDSGGSSLYLKSVLVTDLIEYEKPESNNKGVDGSEWEDSVDDGEGSSKPVPKAAKTAPAPAKSRKAVPPLDEDDDIPF